MICGPPTAYCDAGHLASPPSTGFTHRPGLAMFSNSVIECGAGDVRSKMKRGVLARPPPPTLEPSDGRLAVRAWCQPIVVSKVSFLFSVECVQCSAVS